MAKFRALGCVAIAVVGLCWPVLAVAADGLTRFEAALKDAPPGALTYKSGNALGDNGFVLDDVTLTPPPDATKGAEAQPIAIKQVAVEDFDFAAVDKKAPPNFIKMRIEGIAISGKPAKGIDLVQLAGIKEVTANFALDYRLDPAKKTLVLNLFELDLKGLARVQFSMTLDGVNPGQMSQPDAAMKDATLRTASLTFEDRSLLSKMLPAVAKAQGSDADAMVKMGAGLVAGMRAGQGPAALAVLDALVSYMNDYKHPQGPLHITLKPPAKTSAASAMADIKTPDDAVKALGLTVSYAGTKPGGPPPEPAAPSPATPPGGH